jgi:hypothetical protein
VAIVSHQYIRACMYDSVVGEQTMSTTCTTSSQHPDPLSTVRWRREVSEAIRSLGAPAHTSWFLTGHVVMHVDEGQLSLASFIRYDRWPAACVWPPVSLIHRQVALTLVRSAIRTQFEDTALHT